MKVLFVIKSINFVESFGILQLSSILKTHGHNVFLTIIDQEDPFLYAKKVAPDVIAYSITSGNHILFDSYNRKFKEIFPRVFTIAGGPHPTFFQDFLKSSSLDAICVGEGDKALVELMDKIESGRDFHSVNNIHLKQDGVIYKNKLNSLVEDLDALPYIDRKLFYSKSRMRVFPIKSFMASRGCPFGCTYCFNNAYDRLYTGRAKRIRRRSVDNVLTEIKMVKEAYPLQLVKFFDDIFAFRADEWLEEFANRYRREIGLPLHCLTRANLVDEKMVSLLKKAGCYSVGMAIESGDNKIRQKILHRYMTEQCIIDAFNLFKKYGIYTYSENMVGLPESNRSTEMKTLDINIKSNVSLAGVTIFTPYPGTDIYRYCVEKGYFDGNVENIHNFFLAESILNCFTKEEKQFQKTLSKLGCFIVRFPRLVKYVELLNKLPSLIQFIIYFFTKAHIIKTKIYPFKTSIFHQVKIASKGIIVEKRRHIDGQNMGLRGRKNVA